MLQGKNVLRLASRSALKTNGRSTFLVNHLCPVPARRTYSTFSSVHWRCTFQRYLVSGASPTQSGVSSVSGQRRSFFFWREDNETVQEEDFSEAAVTQQVDTLLTEIRECLSPTIKGFYEDLFATHSSPMVMFLGNHSSGKSSIINYLTGRDIQHTGVAPTDDGFTMIQRGEVDIMDDGFAASSNPDLSLQELQRFGPEFLTRFKVKIASMPETSKLPMNLILLDTPGMIDTPMHVGDRRSVAGQHRGYDFLGATRWFARRSDLIVLFFDPANPGTTGETLDVLSIALKGMEHKIILCLNKSDIFTKVTDYGRSYGALCWNLSKVLKTKDLPQLYTTAVPTFLDASEAELVVPREEIMRQVSEVLVEITTCNMRRLNNVLTNTEEAIQVVLVSSEVSIEVKNKRNKLVQMYTAALVTATVLLPGLLSGIGAVSLAVVSALIGVCGVFQWKSAVEYIETLALSGLDDAARRALADAPEMKGVWETVVRPQIMEKIQEHKKIKLSVFPRLPCLYGNAPMRLRNILQQDIPQLRVAIRKMKMEIVRKQNEKKTTTSHSPPEKKE